MTLVKVCGVTLADDAAAASAAGVDFVGLNFWSGSKRHVAPSRGALLAAATRAAGGARVVGVFVDASVEEVASIVREVDLDIVQLHGHEPPETVAAIATETRRPVWKALAADEVGELGRYTVDAILLDTPTAGRGGSGAVFDWTIARDARVRHPERLLVLAGGLTPENVAAAIAAVDPWAIDVASGVEAAPGIKDGKKIAALVAAVRAAR